MDLAQVSVPDIYATSPHLNHHQLHIPIKVTDDEKDGGTSCIYPSLLSEDTLSVTDKTI